MIRYLFFLLAVVSCFLSPALALFLGIVFALFLKSPFSHISKKISKYLLQVAVVGLGFGINLHESLAVGKEGIVFTVISVVGVMVLGCLLGRWLKLQPKLSYLVASGTAICGGSAIAAIAPIVKASEDETSVSLAVVFTLNAIALFLFPPIGKMLALTQEQFGMWAAIAIHDTSSVVGAGAEYGTEALTVATMVKLTRALWIIPLSLVSLFVFKQKENKKISIPWFIFLFILAMIINTYIIIPEWMLQSISFISHKFLSLTLFLIGSTLSVAALRHVGLKPVVMGIALWGIISLTSLLIIL